ACLSVRPRAFFLVLYGSGGHRALPSFPTRRSSDLGGNRDARRRGGRAASFLARGRTGRGGNAGAVPRRHARCRGPALRDRPFRRSEEHTSELQSRENLVCRLLLEKKKSLPQKWQVVLWHREVEGEGAEVVAGLLGIEPHEVTGLVHRARADLTARKSTRLNYSPVK